MFLFQEIWNKNFNKPETVVEYNGKEMSHQGMRRHLPLTHGNETGYLWNLPNLKKRVKVEIIVQVLILMKKGW